MELFETENYRMDRSKRKIGLLTLWMNANFGTALQAYALCEVISRMGHEAEYVLYNSRRHLRLNEKIRLICNRLSYIVRGCFVKSDLIPHNSYLPMMDFWDSIPHSSIIFDRKTLPDSTKLYSRYIVGGDQVWSRSVTIASPLYFLEGLDDGVSRNSYSPSFGSKNLTSRHKKQTVKYLSLFKHIGCRDISLSARLKSLLGREVVNTVDPVLLLTQDDWHAFSEKLSSLPSNYLLCYELGNTESMRLMAEEKARSQNLELLYMSHTSGDISLSEISPANFVYLFENAAHVVTDSYHGILFSIIFRKKVTPCLKRPGNESTFDNWRIYELCDFLNIQIGLSAFVDKAGMDRLGAMIRQSNDFLLSILDD